MRLATAVLLFAAACSSKSAPSVTDVGATPPAIKLTNGANAQVALADITSAHPQTIVVFYRGFF